MKKHSSQSGMALKPEEAEAIKLLPPRNRDIALWHFRVLQGFLAADEANGFRDRCKTAERYVQAVKRRNPDRSVSVKSLWRWEAAYRMRGIAGLAGLAGRFWSKNGSGLDPLQLAKQIENAKALLGFLEALAKGLIDQNNASRGDV